MNCRSCKSSKVVAITAKCDDLCTTTDLSTGKFQEGCVPTDVGIGGGDYLKICICFQCGQLQGKFPLSDEKYKTVFGKVDEKAVTKLFQDAISKQK